MTTFYSLEEKALAECTLLSLLLEYCLNRPSNSTRIFYVKISLHIKSSFKITDLCLEQLFNNYYLPLGIILTWGEGRG